MLENHRLERIETVKSRDRFPRYVGRNAFGKAQAYGAGNQIRVITTDQGARGWAAAATPEEELQPLIGERISDLIDPDVGAMEHALGIDQPLHDLAGRILNKPVYQLLGGKGPTNVPIYSGSIYFDDLEPEDEPRGVPGIIASCRQDYETGYRAFKLKIGRGSKWMPPEEGLQRDIDAVRAVRENFPDCKILVDANDTYSLDDFIRFLDGVADCDLYWIEEPFPEDETDLKKLKDHMAKISCNALIAEGEARAKGAQPRNPDDPPWCYGYYTREHIENLYDLHAKGLVDTLVLDLNIVGFTRWRHIMPDLIKANIPVGPHTWCWCVRPHYVAQLGAGLGNVICIEGIPGTCSGLDFSNYKIVNGDMIVPDLPGFAMPLKEGESE
ncbi:MAG: enolase C-terminal domain-like protein [Candidatus Latescibacteria bacterium]|jgi:L-alanine-DL-glutamate epimerase-like enolase superfamily enzyme|nr:enolase C-terminal domain-like protein [Candidatus Latescibacterota bacterium]